MIIGILGMTQGGTSAVASVVYSLGVKMYGLDRTLDDAELFGPPKIPLSVVKQRGPDWAYKYPTNAKDHDLSFTDKFIVVWRDPIARAVHRRDFNAPNPEYLKDYIPQAEKLLATPGPVLHVSYEKLLLHTQETCQTIADFLEKPLTKEALLAVDPQKGYERTKEVNKG
jgi:hypothetical protein